MHKRFAIIGLILALPQVVLAHATPLLYSPSGETILDKPASETSIHFSERIEAKASSITVFGPKGEPQRTPRAEVLSADPHILTGTVLDEGLGTYTASWHVVSADDGHFTTGAFSWTVGTTTQSAEANTQQFAINHTSSLPEALALFLELLGEALLLASLLLIFKKRSIVVGITLTLLGSGLYLGIKASALASSESAPLLTGLQTFLATAAGRYTLWRDILTLIFGVVALRAPVTSRSRMLLYILISVIALLRALISHAAASLFYPTIGITLNTLHLLAKSAWIGSALYFAFFRGWRENDLRKKFTAIALWSFLIGGITGTYIIWLHLKDFANLFSTEWGLRFVLLGITSLLFLLSHLAAHYRASRWQAAWYHTEATLGILILLLSSLLIITTPPLPRENTDIQETTSQGAVVRIEKDPFRNKNLLLSLKDAGDTEPSKVLALLENQALGIGPIEIHPERLGFHEYAIPESTFTPPGRWHITIIISQPTTYDIYTQFEREIGGSSSEITHSEALTTASILAVILILLAFSLVRRIPPIGPTIGPEKLYKETAALTASAMLLIATVTYLSVSSFQRACETHGDFWNQSVPQTKGIPTSAKAVTGCTIGNGVEQYHFGSEDQYLYFIRQQNISVDIHIPTPPLPQKESTLILNIRNENGKTPNLILDHEKRIHAVLVDDAFTTFAHIHPISVSKGTDTQYELTYIFPKPGAYLLGLTFQIDGNIITKTEKIMVGSPAKRSSAVSAKTLISEIDGFTVSMKDDSLRSNSYSPLSFHIEKDGKQATLIPYLSAGMHIALIKEDLSSFEHAHGSPTQWRIAFPWSKPHLHTHTILPKSFGPNLTAHVLLRSSGRYHIYAEFKDDLGKTHVAHFVRDAE